MFPLHKAHVIQSKPHEAITEVYMNYNKFYSNVWVCKMKCVITEMGVLQSSILRPIMIKTVFIYLLVNYSHTTLHCLAQLKLRIYATVTFDAIWWSKVEIGRGKTFYRKVNPSKLHFLKVFERFYSLGSNCRTKRPSARPRYIQFLLLYKWTIFLKIIICFSPL